MTQKIIELRILPPFAIARLGSADDPMDNYTIELDAPENQNQPLGYRALKPLDTLIVGERSGEIEAIKTPPLPLQFKIGGRIRPWRRSSKSMRSLKATGPRLEAGRKSTSSCR